MYVKKPKTSGFLSHADSTPVSRMTRQPRRESSSSSSPPNSGAVIRLILVLIFSLALLGIHSLDSARGSAAIRGFEAEVDVLLRVKPDDERWDVDELLAHADVTLADENASVMDRLGEAYIRKRRKNNLQIKDPPQWKCEGERKRMSCHRCLLPSLKTCVCRRRSRKSSMRRPKT